MITFNWLLLGFLALYLFQLFVSIGLERINQRHIRKQSVGIPAVFEGFIDREKLTAMEAYSRENSRLGIFQQIISDFVLLAILLSGFLPFMDSLFREAGFSVLLSGLLFWLIPGAIASLGDLPFDYYHTFVVEEKYGFNRSTLKTWIADQLKNAVLSLILFSIILTIVLQVIHLSPNHWWLWGFGSLALFQWLLAILYPVLIAPLFNKFEPLKDQELAARVRQMIELAGLKIKGIFQMDAGKRSGHSNAYFTGLGRAKRIVLFDTLLNSHPPDEVMAVLAHEVGHYKEKHIWKQFFFFAASMAAIFYLCYLLLHWPLPYKTFGFETPSPYVGLFLLSLFGQKAGFFLSPLYMALSRKFEFQADRFSVRLLKSSSSMKTVLKRLSADNLSNLFPHPWYVRFHYSHPPVLERITALEQTPLNHIQENT
jgi:STE24 endopeptidase